MQLQEERNAVYVYADQIEDYMNKNKIYNIDISVMDFLAPIGVSIVTFRVNGNKRDHKRFDNLVRTWAKDNNKIVCNIIEEDVSNSDSGNYESDHGIYIAEDEEAAKKFKNFSRLYIGEKYKTTRKNSAKLNRGKRLMESLSGYEGYLKTAQSAGLPMIFGYTKSRAGDNKYYVNLELICGKDYVDDPVTGYESIGWVDKDNWVKDAQDYLFMWWTDEQSWEDFLEENDVVELDDRDLPYMVWKYDPRKDGYDRIPFSKYVNSI